MCNEKSTGLNWVNWKKYSSDGLKGIPKGIDVEVCVDNGMNVVPFNMDYCNLYFGAGNCSLDLKPQLKSYGKEWVEDIVYSPWVDSDKKPEVVDVFRVLAWKAGKIKYEDSVESERRIVYEKNWIEGDTGDDIESLQIRYQRTIQGQVFEPFAKGIIEIRNKYHENHNANDAWGELLKLTKENDSVTRGIGTVYLITLLHFITGGDMPIYDRFAMSSLVVWKLGKIGERIPEGSIIRGCALPDKNSEAAKTLLEDSDGRYQQYISLPKEHCKDKAVYNNENEYITNREVDRALYVYGHFFKCE